MPASKPLIPVKLTEIPLKNRLAAAHIAARYEPDPDERLALLTAALIPSDRTYWVPQQQAA